MKGRSIPYSDAEKAWVEANCTLPIGDLHREYCARFARADVSASNLNALRKRNGWSTGRTGQFTAGQPAHNKGKKMPFNANSAATRFKKGERRGVAVKLYKPIGTERLSKEGYVERKIHDGLPLQSRWRAVHLIRWEEIHGPVPAGHVLKNLDGDRTNTDPANWAVIPRSLLPRLAGGPHRDKVAYDAAPSELKPTLMALAKLEHRARTSRKGKSS